MPEKHFPLGKLPPEILKRMLAQAPILDERVLLGPGIGVDCAVVDAGANLLVFKSDPITFASDEIGWYVVQVCANDVAAMGAAPRWFLATLLLPEGLADEALVFGITGQINRACRELGISVIGGHTEITHGFDRPVIVGTLIGEVERDQLVKPGGAQPEDRILLTKGVPIEAAAILAREFPERLQSLLSEDERRQAADFLYDPGISVVRDAQLAIQAGKITAMHDPTEGGVTAALWEMAEACGHAFVIDTDAIHIPELAGRICQIFDIQPLAAIASGALLLAVRAADAALICRALETEGIACCEIGAVEAGQPVVWQASPGGREHLPRPERDDITRVFEDQ